MVDFYGSRSTYGSTLSNVVHSWLEARRDRFWSHRQRRGLNSVFEDQPSRDPTGEDFGDRLVDLIDLASFPDDPRAAPGV